MTKRQDAINLIIGISIMMLGLLIYSASLYYDNAISGGIGAAVLVVGWGFGMGATMKKQRI